MRFFCFLECVFCISCNKKTQGENPTVFLQDHKARDVFRGDFCLSKAQEINAQTI